MLIKIPVKNQRPIPPFFFPYVFTSTIWEFLLIMNWNKKSKNIFEEENVSF
jgi:hypothetical protein